MCSAGERLVHDFRNPNDRNGSPLAGIHETDVAAAAASDARVLKAAVQARDLFS
jgi:hypothetical protein